jgi:solute carrier family 36 (proton-coupled amino acid transporter)
MASPSKPVTIKSPRLAAAEFAESVKNSRSTTPIGTPNLQALRNQYGGTPPIANVPQRVISPASGQRTGSPSLNLGIGTPSSYRQAVGGISASKAPAPSASGTATPNPVDLDGLPDEEKAKVLARHLVSKVERQAGDTASEANVPIVESTSSRRPSSGHESAVALERDPSEPFPIPYNAPGADVT